jgi:transposase-like protein
MHRQYRKPASCRQRKVDPSAAVLPVRRDDVLAAIHAGLHGLASELGLLVAVQLLEDEVTQLCGPRYQRLPDRTHTRYGHQRGQITLAGQQLPIQHPRVRYEAAARWLERLSPDAAASLREGLEETLTVVRLGVAEPLRRTLSTTNPVESALSVTRTATARVKRWQDGDMRQRWCAAGLLRAETKFRRVRGHRHLPSLLKALKALTKNKDLDLSEEAT